jgi:hypothetical protein
MKYGFAYLIVFIFLLFNVSALSNTAYASEGTVEIRSTNGEPYHCWASSLYMTNNNRYKLIIGCVELIYPPQPPSLNKTYMLWAVPSDGGMVTKLGELAGGRAQFDVLKAFSALYVTIEANNQIKLPSKNMVMRGSITPISFLIKPISPTPTIIVAKNGTSAPDNQKSATDTSQLSTKDKLITALQRAGLAAGAALIGIVGLIFVVSRSRG